MKNFAQKTRLSSLKKICLIKDMGLQDKSLLV